jgi:hypothetical protein
MTDIATIAKDVRADVRNAIEHGTLTIPPCVRVTIRVNRRGLVPSVNVYFTPADETATDNVNAWKYTHRPDNTSVLSDAVRTAGTAILAMIDKRSDGAPYGEINCNGAIIAIIIFNRNR